MNSVSINVAKGLMFKKWSFMSLRNRNLKSTHVWSLEVNESFCSDFQNKTSHLGKLYSHWKLEVAHSETLSPVIWVFSWITVWVKAVNSVFVFQFDDVYLFSVWDKQTQLKLDRRRLRLWLLHPVSVFLTLHSKTQKHKHLMLLPLGGAVVNLLLLQKLQRILILFRLWVRVLLSAVSSLKSLTFVGFRHFTLIFSFRSSLRILLTLSFYRPAAKRENSAETLKRARWHLLCRRRRRRHKRNMMMFLSELNLQEEPGSAAALGELHCMQ